MIHSPCNDQIGELMGKMPRQSGKYDARGVHETGIKKNAVIVAKTYGMKPYWPLHRNGRSDAAQMMVPMVCIGTRRVNPRPAENQKN
jgi:hypothetical protein